MPRSRWAVEFGCGRNRAGWGVRRAGDLPGGPRGFRGHSRWHRDRWHVDTAPSFSIAFYPEGREATVPWLDVDQKWINDTGAGVLIQANVQGNNITVTLWGTRTRNIHAVKGPGRNVVQPKTILDARPGCVAQAPTPGFDVTAPQIFRNNGAHVRSVRFDTRSIPQDTVTCTHPAP